MKNNYLKSTIKLFVIAFVICSLTTFSSCKEALEEITYSVTINNNSSQDVDIWLSVNGGAFEKTPEGIDAGASRTSSFYVLDTDYSYEARVVGGTDVISEFAFNQSDDSDLTWNITD
jgi:hypothetical protein